MTLTLTEIETKITAKRIPGLIALAAKLDNQAFIAELRKAPDVAQLRAQAAEVRAELRRLCGEPASAPAPTAVAPLDLAQAAATPKAAKEQRAKELDQAIKRGFAQGQAETLGLVGDRLGLQMDADHHPELDEIEAAIAELRARAGLVDPPDFELEPPADPAEADPAPMGLAALPETDPKVQAVRDLVEAQVRQAEALGRQHAQEGRRALASGKDGLGRLARALGGAAKAHQDALHAKYKAAYQAERAAA